MSTIAFPTIILASKNRHKLVELRTLCGIPGTCIRLISEYPAAPDVEENGATFEENALIKARACRDYSGEWALADDSGLEVDALKGAPGIHSARYAGKHGDDAANNRLLLKKLRFPGITRTARFTCAIALVSPGGDEYVTIGHCPGTILCEERGSNGFGYDPLFLPNGYQKTFAELASRVKCRISHRAEAAAEMQIIMKRRFGNPFNLKNSWEKMGT